MFDPRPKPSSPTLLTPKGRREISLPNVWRKLQPDSTFLIREVCQYSPKGRGSFSVKPLADPFGSYGQAIDPRAINFKANSRFVRRQDRPARTYGHRRFDNVFFPITRARRDVARQRESLERSHRDVVRAANAGFQHAAAPYGNLLFAGDVFNFLRLSMPAHAPELYVNDAASAEGDRVSRILRRFHRLVQTNRSLNLLLQFRVVKDVVVPKRLFDHHQLEFIERLEQRRVRESVGRIGVAH